MLHMGDAGVGERLAGFDAVDASRWGLGEANDVLESIVLHDARPLFRV